MTNITEIYKMGRTYLGHSYTDLHYPEAGSLLKSLTTDELHQWYSRAIQAVEVLDCIYEHADEYDPDCSDVDSVRSLEQNKSYFDCAAEWIMIELARRFASKH